MPNPTSSLATLRPDIAGSFEAFDLEAEKLGYIARDVLRPFNVGTQAGVYGKIPLEQLLQQRDTKRSPGSGYSRGNFTFDSANFACKENGTEEPVDDREAKMYAEYFDAEVVAGKRAFGFILRNAEQRAADLVFNTSTWTGASLTTDVSGSLPWATIASAKPLDDVENAVGKVYDGSGLWPNALVINRKVFRRLRNTPQIVDRITASGAGDRALASDVLAAILAEAFDLQYIIVAGSSKNSAKEGQTASVNQIWSSNYAMVCRVAESDDIKEPCIGRTFHWAEDGSVIDGAFETYRDETVRAEIVRVRHDTDESIFYPQAGHLIKIG